MTAIDWLIEQLKINNYISDNAHWLIDDAKEMEKQQIINAYLKDRPKATIDKVLVSWDKSEAYYNETFKTK